MATFGPVTVNTSKVLAKMSAMTPAGRKKLRVVVGYSAPYAVYVHEDMTANHPNGGQAKYLEAAARSPSVKAAMRDAVRKAMKNKKGLAYGLTDSGNVLLRASMPLVPVDTGFLVSSGYVDLKEG